jgi:8-oxo-dGTP pyrophosphatase MutT (NUDIX family)
MKNTCGLFIIDSSECVLTCVGYGGIKNNNGMTVPKGKVEDGESFLQAAIRETKEESGLDFSEFPTYMFEELEPITYPSKKKRFRGFVIRLPFIIDPVKDCYCESFTNKGFPEIIGYSMMSLPEATKWLHHVQSKALINYLKNN